MKFIVQALLLSIAHCFYQVGSKFALEQKGCTMFQLGEKFVTKNLGAILYNHQYRFNKEDSWRTTT